MSLLVSSCACSSVRETKDEFSTAAMKSTKHLKDDEDWQLPLAFNKSRHMVTIEGVNCITQTWRMKERMKTVSVALVLCLNVGVDPPDIIKTQPCARLECWIDPLSMSPQKALETIGSNLQKQYERWQPRARYKQSLDPTVEDVKKLCTSLRRNAKEERVLFHYNGHGVPKPTSNGEIWVFNKTYTQYIPLSVYDLQTWMGAPSIYVYDCSNAGIIVDSFQQFAEQHEKEYEMEKQAIQQNRTAGTISVAAPSYKNCIQLAACTANQILPMNPDLPADIFTSCLTTPIKIALRWFVMQNTSKLVPKVSLELIDKIPGQLTDRRTMLGELNWIFTAITDTIAWNTLPRDLFQRLFRQDLLVASLFRNFLLAERVLRSYDCTPVSCPKLPPTYQHPMWQAWDLALDLCLAQLPTILESEDRFVHSPFFEEQLTAFQVWLTLGSRTRNPPEQLPIVLQVLLSQVHRLRALELLGRFLDLGPWAVNLALSVGIFPYVLKLLQSNAGELRPLLVFIWAKILAVDNTCQADLVRDNGHKYFLSVLQDTTMLSEYRTLAAFVLACIVNNYPPGQEAALQGSLVSICLEQLGDPNPLLRQWLCLCLARLWHNYDKARWCGVRDIAHEKLYTLLQDPVPEVRAASVYALGTFINSVTKRSEHANNIDQTIAMMLINTVTNDMCPLVRKELVVALQWMVLHFENSFVTLAIAEENSRRDLVVETLSSFSGMRRISSKDRLKMLYSNSTYSIDTTDGFGSDKIKRVSSVSSISSLGNNWEFVRKPCEMLGHSSLGNLPSLSYGSVYMKLWHGLCGLDNDPHPGVAIMSQNVTNHIRSQIKESSAPKEVNDTKMSSSLSLPPSPSNRNNFLSNKEESPPTANSTSDLLRSTRLPVHSSRARKPVPNTISEESDEIIGVRTPLITSQFVEWSCAQFAQPVSFDAEAESINDVESRAYHERDWRYLRNKRQRKEVQEEQIKAVNGRIESQVFHTRCPQSPDVLLFHPFDSHLAVACKDYFGIWDWHSGTKLMYHTSRGSRPSRITTLEFINSHDVTLLMVGSDDGSIRVWKNYYNMFGREPTLLTAWQALADLQPVIKGSAGTAGLVTSWEQRSLTLAVTGDVKSVRLWDAETELKVQDIPTGADCCVTSLDTDNHDFNCYKGNMMVLGCGDGSVRLFDRRLPSTEAKIMTYREHNAWVLGAYLRKYTNSSIRLITGSSSGDIKFFDIRKNSSVNTIQTTQGITDFVMHETADIFASSTNQCISMYNISGNHLNTIKFHEGFMSTRIGPVSCLNFHPHRVVLAAGCIDSTVTAYSSEHRR
ncbi:PREDICTED: regulatory-associated protein of mTOR isoform X1 [Ceratosolen solmsi marchali]|uniref:Regulatory-associated protein of mTOR isoform X1 n=1 Tax=Ceratosolen solmsi marchali TaxID=326594 RepID=A0AAJ6YHE4_9HYME|nr:PREDICTED: regulatory-associated protein of mTOR isoform X1 [Ceratosolen solmsi marchali]